MSLTPQTISIHAPREGGDLQNRNTDGSMFDFNPRPPRGGRRQPAEADLYSAYFNPRPPRGGRLLQNFLKNFQNKISIHAPREGGDTVVEADLVGL